MLSKNGERETDRFFLYRRTKTCPVPSPALSIEILEGFPIALQTTFGATA
jgi:hypothetical protein